MATTINTVRDLAAVARGRRQDLRLSQTAVARRAGVSRAWLSGFEAGKPTAELGLVLRLLDALDLRLAVDHRDRASGDRAGQAAGASLDALLDDHHDP